MKRTLIAGLATAAFVSGGLAVGAASAQAQPGFVPQYNWCPGQHWQYTIPPPPDFDWSVCHELTAVTHRDGSATIVEIPNQPPLMCGPVPCGLFP